MHKVPSSFFFFVCFWKHVCLHFVLFRRPVECLPAVHFGNTEWHKFCGKWPRNNRLVNWTTFGTDACCLRQKGVGSSPSANVQSFIHADLFYAYFFLSMKSLISIFNRFILRKKKNKNKRNEWMKSVCRPTVANCFLLILSSYNNTIIIIVRAWVFE